MLVGRRPLRRERSSDQCNAYAQPALAGTVAAAGGGLRRPPRMWINPLQGRNGGRAAAAVASARGEEAAEVAQGRRCASPVPEQGLATDQVYLPGFGCRRAFQVP